MTTTITVRGAERLERTLRTAARDVKALAATNLAAARAIQHAMHPPRRTGRLAGSFTATGDDDGAELGSSLVYAGVIEHGWRGHNIEGRHYLADAEQATRTANLDRYQDHCRDAISGVKGI